MSYWQNQFSTGYINPTPKPHLDITASQSSEIVSILSAGTFFGALLAAPIADRLGRRLALIVSSVVFIFGVVLQTAATEIPLFVAGSTYPGSTSLPIPECLERKSSPDMSWEPQLQILSRRSNC